MALLFLVLMLFLCVFWCLLSYFYVFEFCLMASCVWCVLFLCVVFFGVVGVCCVCGIVFVVV